MGSTSLTDLTGFHNVKDFGATPANLYQALVAANAQAGGKGIILIPAGTYVLGTNFSPSAGVMVWVSTGATLSGAGSLTAGSGMLLDMRTGLSINGVSVAKTDAVTAGTAITAKRFVDVTTSQAAVDSLTVIGVAPTAIGNGAGGAIAGAGLQAVTADAPLSAGDGVKVGVAGRATKYTSAQTTLQTTITGIATSVTQPGSATTLEILQAANVTGDKGRGIVIEGSNGTGVAITETITLNATNTTTVVTGAISFTKVSGVYMADGAVLGAQNVTIRISSAGATVCTLVGGTSQLGANIPAQTQEAYCNEITITGPNSNATYVTIVGTDSTDATVRERAVLDGASPSKVTTTAVFRYVSRICLGEFTNAAAGAVKTNSVVDTAGMRCGVVVTAAAARGNDALILVKPNA